MGRTAKTEAIVLRSFRFGEADRVLHLYALDRGRFGAIAKGVRRTTSRMGGRLEPMSHVEVSLHQGSGELHTVTGVALLDSHRRAREHPYRLQVGLVGLEAMLRLFPEQEANERAFTALARFLSVLDTLEPVDQRPALHPLVLAFQLKLLWLSGYFPHLESCVECGSEDALVGFLPSAGGAVCRACDTGGIPLSAQGVAGMLALVHRPLADAVEVGVGGGAAREAHAVITASYEHHGGFRLRTAAAR